MDILDSALSSIFKNKYSSTIVTIFLIAYASLARPKLPNFITNLFENPIFRVFLLSLIVYRGNKNPKLSILIAMGFVVTMNIISKQKIFDNFTNTDDTPGMDDNMVDTDPDNVGVLDKHGSELDNTYNSDNNQMSSDSNDSQDINDVGNNMEYNSEELDENFVEEDSIVRPEEERYFKPEEERYIRPEEEYLKQEEEYLRQESEGCRNNSDGTDTCGDDEICDNGKCINAT